jgi:membrane protein implicated in regulation of membrane protease activity
MNEYMEIMAYFASVIILISFIVKDVILLRLLNTIGCVLFLIYSTYYGRYPLIFLNFMVIVVNLIYIYKPIVLLWKERSKRKS